MRNNMPLLAYIAGKPDAFTSKDHNFLPGRDRREAAHRHQQLARDRHVRLLVVARPAAGRSAGSKTVTVATGEQERIPLQFALPADLPRRAATTLHATVAVQHRRDAGGLVRHRRAAARRQPAAAGGARSPSSTRRARPPRCSSGMGVAFEPVDADADLAGYDMLIVGKAALTRRRPGARTSRRVRDGLKVVVFEQTADVLEKRLGFRVGRVRPAAGLPARAGPSAPGRPRRRAPAQLARARRRSCRRA